MSPHVIDMPATGQPHLKWQLELKELDPDDVGRDEAGDEDAGKWTPSTQLYATQHNARFEY